MVVKNGEDDASREAAPAAARIGASRTEAEDSMTGDPSMGRILSFPPPGQRNARAAQSTASPMPSTVITGNGYQAGSSGSQQPQVTFHRRELDRLLRLYGFKVASGEWRDYAIDMLRDRAVFSVFRRTSEMPLHCIEKIPALARKQGQWCVTGADGRILKRGNDLDTVLRVLEKQPRLKVI